MASPWEQILKQVMHERRQEDSIQRLMQQRAEHDRPSRIAAVKESAEKGDLDALCEMGLRHRYGWGATLDAEKAIQYLERAAMGGNAKAREALAEINVTINDRRRT